MFLLYFQGLLIVVSSASATTSSEWSFYSYLGDSLDLVCDDLSTNITLSEHGEWALPSGNPVTAGDHHYTLETRLTTRGYVLKVSNITEKMSGIYICNIIQEDGTVRTRVLRGLNLSGHKFRHWTDKYTTHFIRGCVAASCLLVPMLMFCLVQKFRFRTDGEDPNGGINTTYQNKGFDDFGEKKANNLDTRI